MAGDLNLSIRITADGKVAAAELRNVTQSLDQVSNTAAKSAGSLTQSTAAAERLRSTVAGTATSANQAARAVDDLGQRSRLTGQQLQNLSYQLNDVAVSLASGQNAFRVLLQQGSQITPIFGGIANTFKAMLTPLNLAIGAGVAAGGAFLALAARAAQADQQFRNFSVALGGTGRSAEAMRGTFEGMVSELARLPGVSRTAAAELAAGLGRNRQISAELYADVVKVGTGFAKAFGVDAADGVDAFGKVLSSPATAVAEFAERTGALTAAQVKLVQSLDNSGQRFQAQKTIIEAAKVQFGDLAVRGVSQAANAADNLAKAWDRMLDTLSKTPVVQGTTGALGSMLNALTDTFDPKARPLQERIAEERAIVEANPVGARGSRARERLRDLEAQFAQQQSLEDEVARRTRRVTGSATPSADVLNLRRSYSIFSDALPQLLPLDAQRERLTQQRSALFDVTLDKMIRGDDASEAMRAGQQIDANLRGLLTPTQQAQLSAASASRVAGAAPGARAFASAREAANLAALTGNVPERDRAAFVDARTQEQLAPIYAAARDQVATLGKQAELAERVAAAYQLSLAAGKDAERVAARELEHFKNQAVEKEKLVAFDRQLAQSETLKVARIDNAAAAEQVEAERRIAEARKISNAAAEEAARLNEQDAYAKKLTAQAGGVLNEELQREIERRKQLSAEFSSTARQSRMDGEIRTAREEQQLLSLELSLLGQSEATRNRILGVETAKLRLAREYGAELPGQQAELLRMAETNADIRTQIEQQRRAQELWLEPLKNAIQGIQSSFAGLFKSIIGGGVTSFRDFAAAVKNVFVDLAAQIAALLVFQPIVGGILGSVGLGGLAQQMGFGGGGSAGGGILGALGSIGSVGSGLNFLSGGSLFSGIGNIGSSIASTFGFGAGMPGAILSGGMDAVAAGEFANMAHMGNVGLTSGLSLGTLAGGAGLAAGIAGQFIRGRGGSALSFGGAGLGLAAMLGAGPVGLAAAAVGGGLLGGLFGGGKKKSVGPGGTAGVFLGPGGAYGQPTSADNGYDGGQTTGLAQQAAAALNRIAQASGGSLTDRAVAGFAEQGGRLSLGFDGEGYGIDAGDDPIGTYIRAALERGAIEGGDARVIDALKGGQSIEQVAAAFNALREEATRLAQSLKQAAEDLRLSDLSPFKDAEKVSLAKQRLDRDVELAAGNDHQAMARLAGDVAAWLQFSMRQNDRASDQYIADFNTGQAILERFASQAEQEAANLPRFALGGRPQPHRLSLVGERGPELFVPDSAGTILPNHELFSRGPSRAEEQIIETLKRIERQNQRDGDRWMMGLAQIKAANRRTTG